MKMISLFTKAPNHRRFSYSPRYYDPEEEQRKEREERIKNELGFERPVEEESVHISLIAGSFRAARKTSRPAAGTSIGLLRLIILTFIVLWLLAVFEFGTVAIYGIILLVPFYFYLKFRSLRK